MGAATSDVSVNVSPVNTTIEPGDTAVAAEYTFSAQNASVTVSDAIVNQFPFDNVSFSPRNFTLEVSCTTSEATSESTCPVETTTVTATVAVPDGFPPGDYRGSTVFVLENRSNKELPLDVTVPAFTNWTVQNTSFASNVSVGSKGEFGSFEIVNTGNTDTELTVNASGNLSQFLEDVPRTVDSWARRSTTERFQYNLRDSTPFGHYTGVFTITDETNRTRSVNVSTTFEDTISPTITETQFPGFMATKPEEFVIVADDNIAVDSVTAEILNEDQIVVNETTNETETVNKTLETVEFTEDDDTGQWMVTPPADRIGSYFVEGQVIDAAGNTVPFADQYSVTGLNVTSVLSNVSIPQYRIETDVVSEIGELEKPTDVTVTLDYFDQPLNDENETWKVGLVTPNRGTVDFTDVGDTVVLEEAGPIKLFVYSTSPERYSGELSFEGVPQHVSLPTLNFNGRFVEYTVPRNQTFDVYNVTHTCDTVRSDQLANAGWNCEYFISAADIRPGSSLENELRMVVPKAVEDRNKVHQETLDQQRGQTRLYQFIAVVEALLILLFVGLSIYFVRYYPSHYVVRLKDTD